MLIRADTGADTSVHLSIVHYYSAFIVVVVIVIFDSCKMVQPGSYCLMNHILMLHLLL